MILLMALELCTGLPPEEVIFQTVVAASLGD